LKQVVRGLKAEGDVEVFSIGIAGMDTSAYYENAVRVVNTASLADESLPVLRGLLKRAIKKQGAVQ
jgi:cobalamin biosynthesis protein CobT